MPSGDNPNSRKALEENRAKGYFNAETAVKAQLKSAESHKLRHSQAELLRAWYNKPNKGKESAILEGEEMIGGELLTMTKLRLAREGNLEAIKYIEKQLGIAPDETKNVNITGNISTEGEMIIGFLDSADEEE